ncbi:dockerin type I domain-containing protein [Ruminococcus flavefaciens]|uniref:Dockerin domain-containing protein n=1 Tax=Ruminococcus flavefaciens 007c TaxID=1341157 RepID=W7V183_RUMFL|nr:dockerin type I domain-containing protein [Ruminococcus flavefaciens]EWM54740.1 hypothetical protein RF007C_02355 [Ruminococcus flavefaciens 007c]
MFPVGSTVIFDVSLNDTPPTEMDINDVDVDKSYYTIEGNRIYGRVKIDESYYHPNFCFVDFHSDTLCGDFTINDFCVVSANSDNITENSSVEMDKDHTLHAVWEKTVNLGDVNNDGQVDAVDASSVLAYYARISTNQNGEYTEEQKLAADVNDDGQINAVDASNILAYYTYVSTTKDDIVPIDEYLKKM